jgi:hypothetical protein
MPEAWTLVGRRMRQIKALKFNDYSAERATLDRAREATGRTRR